MKLRPSHWGLALVAVLVLGVLLGEAAGWPFLRQPLQDMLARRTGLPTGLEGGFRLHLLGSPRLDVGRLRLGAAPGFDLPHLIDAQDVRLGWRWTDLWRWRQGERLRVQLLQARSLDAHLLRQADGRASWLGAGPHTGHTELPVFGTLVVSRGRLAWVDEPLDVDLRVQLQGREGAQGQGQLSGFEAHIEGRYRQLPLKLDVRAGGALPLLNDAESNETAPWVPLRVQGQVASSTVFFEGQAAALMGSPRWDGALRFKGPSLALVGRPLGVTLPQSPPFDLQGHIAQTSGVSLLRVDKATVGSSQLRGELRFDHQTQPRRLSGQLSGPRLALADLGPAVGGRTEGTRDTTPPGRVLPHRHFDLPSLKAMDADVQMQLDVLDLGSASVAPLKNLRTVVHLQGGVLRLQDLQARVAGGQFSGSTELDANASPARWQARLHLSGIDMAGWLRGLRKNDAPAPRTRSRQGLKQERQQARAGGDQPLQAYLTGELAGDVDVKGAGRSTAEILGSLSGRAQLAIREGTLSYLATEVMGLDVAQALGVVIQGDRPLPLRCARLVLSASNGVVQPRPAVLDNVDSTIWLTGRVNLRDETLDLRAITQPKDWTPLSLRAPITVTGTLAKPQVGIEGSRLVGKVLGALALGAAAGPVAALLPLIEQGEGNLEHPCEARTTGPANAPAAAVPPPPPAAPAPPVKR